MRERHHRLSRNRTKRLDSGHVLNAGDGSGGGHGRGGGHGNGKADVGESTNEVDGGSTAAAGGDGSSAKTTEGRDPVKGRYRCGNKGHRRVNYTEKLCKPVQRTRARW